MPVIDTKLKALYHEVGFWIALLMSLPGIGALYVAAYHAVQAGHFDAAEFQSAFLALPVLAYLIARQYPRGKAVEAAGASAFANMAVVQQAAESNPPAGATPQQIAEGNAKLALVDEPAGVTSVDPTVTVPGIEEV